MWWLERQSAELKVDPKNPIMAAYSAQPFMCKSADPNLRFYQDEEGRYWCLHIGDFNVEWGIGESLDYKAHGVVTLTRKKVKPVTFRDVPAKMYITDGGICYLYLKNTKYDEEMDDFVRCGYDPYISEAILIPCIRELAKRVSYGEFPEEYKKLKWDPKINAFLKERGLKWKDARLEW